jgi:hypothetical protein
MDRQDLASWDATLADGEQVLDSLTFTNPWGSRAYNRGPVGGLGPRVTASGGSCDRP